MALPPEEWRGEAEQGGGRVDGRRGSARGGTGRQHCGPGGNGARRGGAGVGAWRQRVSGGGGIGFRHPGFGSCLPSPPFSLVYTSPGLGLRLLVPSLTESIDA